MIHIRPWQFFRLLPGNNPFERMVRLPIPFRKGSDIQTILALDTLLLITAARIVNAKTIVEFGTCAGATALNLAINLPEAHIHCVDIERRPRDYDGTRYADQISEYMMPIAEFKPFDADLVFQDINYTRQTVVDGTDKALKCFPKCIAFHDYGHPDHPHVKEHLDTLPNMIHIEDSWMVFWFRDEVKL